MLAYSPYDNVTATAYPPTLVLAGLTDPRVTYWEPAKWVARLRERKTGQTPPCSRSTWIRDMPALPAGFHDSKKLPSTMPSP